MASRAKKRATEARSESAHRWAFGLQWAIASVLSITACRGNESSPEPSAGTAARAVASRPASSTVELSPAVDVAALKRRVHFAFSKQGTAMSGGHSTYTVEVDANGAFMMTPFHHPRHAPSQRSVVKGAPISFETLEVAREGQSLLSTPAEPRVQMDGSLVIQRGEVKEQLRNTAEGVEQSWRFNQRPQGQGELVVQVSVRGAKFRGRTLRGNHFGAAEQGLGLRYGHATWIDAKGRRTPVMGEVLGEVIVMRVPLQVLTTSLYPAVLDPIIGPEIKVSEPAFGPISEQNEEPTIAYGGGYHLLAWQDGRGAFKNIVCSRIAPDGTVVDPAGIRPVPGELDQTMPSVAFGNGSFLVVWQHQGSGSQDIFGVRIQASDGVVLDPTGIAISTAQGEQGTPGVAFDGTNYFVVWQDQRNADWEIFGARVNTQGSVVSSDVDGLLISTNASTLDQKYPSVVFGGTQYLVVWQDYRNGGNWDVYGTRVSPAGAVLDLNGIAIGALTNNQEYPAVAYDDAHNTFLVVYQDNRRLGPNPPTTQYDIRGARLKADGTFVDNMKDYVGIPISAFEDDDFNQTHPSVAFDGTNYLVIWQDDQEEIASLHYWDIYGARVDPVSGDPIEPSAGVSPIFPICLQPRGDQTMPVVSFAPGSTVGTGQYMTAWADYRSLNGYTSPSKMDIFGTTVGMNGNVSSLLGHLLSSELSPQNRPAAAFDGNNFLLVWQDYRIHAGYPGWDIFGARISQSGVVQDTMGIQISLDVDDQKDPSIAWDGTNYLVVWSDYRNADDTGTLPPTEDYKGDIYGARVRPADGVVLDVSGRAIYAGFFDQRRPSVAFNGTVYLVAWEDYRTNNQYDIYAARVNAAGNVQDASGFPVSYASYDQFFPAVASDGSGFLVVWQDQRYGSEWDIFGARIRVSPSPQVDDPTGFVISISGNNQTYPRVVFGGTRYLVAWQSAQNVGSWDVYAARVDPQSQTIDPGGVVIANSAHNEAAPAVGHDGVNFLVAWQDDRNGNDWDIYATRVTNQAVVADAQGFAISIEAGEESAPALTSNKDGTYLVAYLALDTTVPYGVDRLRVRMLGTLLEDGETCAVGFDCKSIYCIDGVCCNDPCGEGVSNDCQACNLAAALGVCTALPSTVVCRASTGLCDLAENCDGSAMECPTDQLAPAATICHPSNGACDVVEVCNGTTANCPSDTFLPNSEVCHPAASECDVEELCSGTSAGCPADHHQPNGTLCSLGVCIAGVCGPIPDGGIPDSSAPDGGPPSDGAADSSAGDATGLEAGPDLATLDRAIPDASPAVDRSVDRSIKKDVTATTDTGVIADAPTVLPDTVIQPKTDVQAPFWNWDAKREEGCSCAVGQGGATGLPSLMVLFWLIMIRFRKRKRE